MIALRTAIATTATTSTTACKLQDLDTENHANIKFLVKLGDGNFDEKIACSTLCIA
jgi:hypothetical protein